MTIERAIGGSPIGVPRTTRAVALDASGQAVLRSIDLPALEPGELLLELELCGLCGSDLFKIGRRSEGGAASALPSARLGHELVGRVCAAGKAIDSSPPLSPGDRVVVTHHVACGNCGYCRRGSETLCSEFRRDLLFPGGFSDLIVVGRRAAELAARRLPAELSSEAALFLEPAACVLRGILRAQLPEAGARVAILGGGSMGLLHLLVLRALDPTIKVLMIEPIEERRQLATELGADLVTSTNANDLEGCGQQIAAPELRFGVDAVFDTAGGQRALIVGLSLLREGGTFVLFAHDLQDDEPGSHRAAIDLNRLFKSEQRIVGSYSGSLAESNQIFDLLVAGRLDPSPLITHRLPLSRFHEAIELYRNHEALKVLIEREP